MNDIKQTLRQFILVNHLQGELPENLRDETPLFSSGILDSLAGLGLMDFVQREFAITLDVYDTSIERFDRIQDIAMCVVRKRGAASPAPESLAS